MKRIVPFLAVLAMFLFASVPALVAEDVAETTQAESNTLPDATVAADVVTAESVAVAQSGTETLPAAGTAEAAMAPTEARDLPVSLFRTPFEVEAEACFPAECGETGAPGCPPGVACRRKCCV